MIRNKCLSAKATLCYKTLLRYGQEEMFSSAVARNFVLVEACGRWLFAPSIWNPEGIPVTL